MDQKEAEGWARDWIDSWNSHDLQRVLDHFSEDAVFSSPMVPLIVGRENPLRGRAELAVYWEEGLRQLPQLHFTLRSVFLGVETLAIAYQNEGGRDGLEMLALGGDGLAHRGWALYGSQPGQSLNIDR